MLFTKCLGWFVRIFARLKFSLKKWVARYRLEECIKSEQDQYRKELMKQVLDRPRQLETQKGCDGLLFYGEDQLGNSILLKLQRQQRRKADIWLIIRLQDGRTFTLPEHPATQIYNVPNDIFRAGGLSIEILNPFISVRINFYGLLRPRVRPFWTEDINEEELVLVKFSFIFSAKSKPIYWPYDWNLDLMASALSNEPWEGLRFIGLLIEPESRGYDQYGALKGELFIGGAKNAVGGKDVFTERQELNLPGMKVRRWGPTRENNLDEVGFIIGVCKDGMVFNVGAFLSQEPKRHAHFGNMIHPNGFWDTINYTDVDAQRSEEENVLESPQIVHFRVKNQMYNLQIQNFPASKVTLHKGIPIEWRTEIQPISFLINGERGRGVKVSSYTTQSNEYGPTKPGATYKRVGSSFIQPAVDQFVHFFYEDLAKSILVSGGKGASLAILSSIARMADVAENFDGEEDMMAKSETDYYRQFRINIVPPKMSIPEGFVVSVSALEKIISGHASLETNINQLTDLQVSNSESQLRGLCYQISYQIRDMKIDEEVHSAITEALGSLRTIYGKGGKLLLAVRSSSVAEDRDNISGAGQNETYLGLRTEYEVLSAIKECWASFYSYRSVQYRRRNLQPMRTGMAVVVQRMIASEVSGVMFTQHPISGNTKQVLISCNFGLGEAVVSGEVDPDDYTVSRDYADSQFKILSRKMGNKKIMLQMNHYSGRIERKPGPGRKLSLNDAMVLRLTEIGVVLEKMYGSPRDIEWGVKGDHIYVFQARPITALNHLSDWELKHEFDVPVMTEEDLRTTANVQEVLPNAITLPTMHFISIVDRMLKVQLDGKGFADWNVNRFMTIINYHLFLDIYNFILRNNVDQIRSEDVIMGYALMGRDFLTQEIHRVALKRYPPTTKQKLRLLYKACKSYLLSHKYPAYSANISSTFRNYFSDKFGKYGTSLELLTDIESKFSRIYDCARCHYETSMMCTFYQTIALRLLSEGMSINSEVVQEDARLILSGINGTESGSIPKQMEGIMRSILISGYKDEFCSLDKASGRGWLNLNLPEASKLFEIFIDTNRHRGIREMELYSITWGMDPSMVVEMLQQAMVMVTSIDDLINVNSVNFLTPAALVRELQSPKKWITKFFLKRIVTRAQRSVVNRELTKSSLTSVLHEFRLAYWHLGAVMVQEGLLPDNELIFFMSPSEWRILIESRDPELVRRAIQRKRIFPQLDNDHFPEFCPGVPQPIEEAPMDVSYGDEGIQGTSIYGGKVKGRACVILGFEDAGKIRAGDILITRSTDIGWSPYYPILKGLVTELGGLLSHGTIVAREYGLPCIVAAAHATKFFRHGETVFMDADNGIIFKATED